jgi:hypothetical protein
MDQIFSILEPTIMEFAGLAITALVTMLTISIRRYLGVKAEAEFREALHRALTTGAAASQGTTIADIAQDAIKHAQNSVPDKLKQLNPTAEVLTNIAVAKAIEVLNSRTTK